MSRLILPEAIRENIKFLLGKGYRREAVAKFTRDEAKKYVNSDRQLILCITRIEQTIRGIPNSKKAYPSTPETKYFDPNSYFEILSKIRKGLPTKKIEEKGAKIAKDLLKKHEKFKNVKSGPDFAGTPFDFFGFKGGNPYIIELKCSLRRFQYPGEIQKIRMQELLMNMKGLHVCLLQLVLKEGKYRMFYDDQMDLLFYGSKMPIDPVENWIRLQLKRR